MHDSTQSSLDLTGSQSLKLDDLEAFIEGQAPLLSRGELFIATNRPLSVGIVAETEIRILSLGLNFKVEGTVISALPKSTYVDGPYGMTLRLSSIGEIERRFFDKVILWYNERHSEAPLCLPRYAIEDLDLPIVYPDMMPTEQLSMPGENGAGLMDNLSDEELERIASESQVHAEGIRARAKRLLELRR